MFYFFLCAALNESQLIRKKNIPDSHFQGLSSPVISEPQCAEPQHIIQELCRPQCHRTLHYIQRRDCKVPNKTWPVHPQVCAFISCRFWSVLWLIYFSMQPCMKDHQCRLIKIYSGLSNGAGPSPPLLFTPQIGPRERRKAYSLPS